MDKTIKAAVLGMGGMGKTHAKNLMKMEHVELTALCSRNMDTVKAFAEENQLNCLLFTDAYEMLESVELDVLFICLPPYAHNGQLEAAAAKGIHVFIEKPIALTLERGKSMAEAALKHQIYTQVGYHMRFGSAVKKFKEYVENGTAGKMTLYTAAYECNSLHSPWWRDVSKCGGQVFEQLIHLYDMGLYMMGPAKNVNGYIANLCHSDIEDYTVEDTSVCNIRFVNGGLGSITGSNCADKRVWKGRFRIVCEHMIADFEDFNHATFTFTKDEVRTEEFAEDVDPLFEEVLYFLDVVRGKKPETANIKEGYQGLCLVSAVVESSKKSGMTIEIM